MKQEININPVGGREKRKAQGMHFPKEVSPKGCQRTVDEKRGLLPEKLKKKIEKSESLGTRED